MVKTKILKTSCEETKWKLWKKVANEKKSFNVSQMHLKLKLL